MAFKAQMYGTPRMVYRSRRYLKLEEMFFFFVMFAFAVASTNFVNVMLYWRKVELFDKYFGAREHVGRTNVPASSIKERNVGNREHRFAKT